ncbi:MAG: chromate transporter [Acidobacteriota bacterium]|nr:chromate transporter [Acidobacteriota bacterium]
MSLVLLYLLLLKATATSFSGLSSLPVLRNDLVVHHRVLTDRQLSTAVAAGRLGPGPLGLYVVSAGYFVAGVPGAIVGWAAMVTPAFLVLVLLRFLGSRTGHPRVKSVIRCLLLASAGLLLASSVPLARDGLTGPLTLAVAAASFAITAFTRVDTLWVILGSALTTLLAVQL